MTRDLHKVGIANPLGVALDHYADRLDNAIEQRGRKIIHETINEPSHAGYGRVQWIVRHYAAVFRLRRRKCDIIFILWPPLGLLDVALTTLLCGSRGRVVIHDPEPLVKSVGYGPASAFFARKLNRSSIVSHSAVARDSLRKKYRLESTCVPLPVNLHEIDYRDEHKKIIKPTLTVFGQYKPDRDIELMTRLVSNLSGRYDLRVYGRRWPDIEGWSVDARFVPEGEIDKIIMDATVILIPYRKFFQSDIAIRCMELGTPFVGPVDSSLSEIVGDERGLLAHETTSAWVSAIEYASALTGERFRSVREAYALRAKSAWTDFLAE